MIQILGLRTYKDAAGKTRTAEKFFDKGWRFDSVAQLFQKAHEFVETVPPEERYNLFYTAANCFERPGRVLEFQEVIPFDIDGTEPSEHPQVIEIVSSILNVKADEMAIIASGNGIHFIVGLTSPITSDEYFEENKPHYKMIAGKIGQAMFLAGISGGVDTSVFSTGRIMRLPYTKNVKPHGETYATMINNTIIPQNFDFLALSGAGVWGDDDHISPEIFSRYPVPDTHGVQEGCSFLKYVKKNQNDVTEPQWYAALSIIGRLENGRELAQIYSRDYKGYSERETDSKLDHSLKSSGPRTCDNISTLWDGCPSCPHFRRCKSPITIKSDSYIVTKATGFYDTVLDETTGLPKKTKINFADLMLYFRELHQFVVHGQSGAVSVFKRTHWCGITDNEINAFCESHINPKPKSKDCAEFLSKIKRNFMVSSEFFAQEGKANFGNGVLEFQESRFSEHNEKHGFTHVLPFDYDPHATCPSFDGFLDSVTLGDKQVQMVLLEFMGATLAGAPSSKVQKALICVGDGSNGKSVFAGILRALCGKGNYSVLTMGREIEKMENRYTIDGKLCNISEETPTNALRESEMFKALVTGSEITARRLYADTYEMIPKAKVVMLCNKLPETTDGSYGMERRLLIVKFKATFKNELNNMDVNIQDKMMPELSGIFNKCYEAYKKYKDRGYRFTEAQSIKDENEEYMHGNKEPEILFAEECLLKNNDGKIKSQDLFHAYERWCIENRVSDIKRKNNIQLTKSIRHYLKLERKKGNGLNFLLGAEIHPAYLKSNKQGSDGF